MVYDERVGARLSQSGAPGNEENTVRTLRRILSILLGATAGVAAVKILRDYDSAGPIEGEFTELPSSDGEPDEEAAPGPGSSFGRF